MTNLTLAPLFLAISVLFCATPNAQSDSDRLSQSLKSLDKKMSSMQQDLSRSMSEIGKARQGLKELNKKYKKEQREARQTQDRQRQEIAALGQELAKCKKSFQRQLRDQEKAQQRSLAKLEKERRKLSANHESEVQAMASEVVRLQHARAKDARKVQEALKRNHVALGAILATATEQQIKASKQAPRRRRCSPSRDSVARRVREELARRAKANEAKTLRKINEEE